MTVPTNHQFAGLVDRLTDGQAHRVWSLLITVFGDLAQEEGQWIAANVLKQITAAIGIKPEATRVALYRLRQDGWLINRKNGRMSDYSLTAYGRAQCAAANPRIYGPAPALEAFNIIVSDPQSTPSDDGVVWLGQNVGLGTTANPEMMRLPIPELPLPVWMQDAICNPELMAACRATTVLLRQVHEDLSKPEDLSPLQVAVLRILIVHTWRRLILKTPELPDEVFPADWNGRDCRDLVSALLGQLGRPEILAQNASLARVG